MVTVMVDVSLFPMVSIIVPFKRFELYVEECVQNCLQLDYANFEILLLPDFDLPSDKTHFMDPRVKVISTGEVIPPVKRNIAAQKASGEILAFLDSDAYPRSDWLRNAVRYFERHEVVAVGGPGITPATDNLRQKASGEILASIVGSGQFRFRHRSSAVMECDDIPSANLLVRKETFVQVKGFDPKYWTGEDTEFCIRILGLKKKMLYAPDVVVYHHRRTVFRGHLQQIARYGLHRGYFVRRFPETSRRLIYFAPSVLVIFLFVGLLASTLSRLALSVYATIVVSYLLVCSGAAAHSAVRNRSLQMFGLVAVGIILTHVSYGLQFLRGLTLSKLADA
jgi:cellulose synthase/poly-beta-1,6-N-acetylglucosamine synthase-like glycosyltransferase